MNIKVVQDALGHKDVKTTLDVYADVTKNLKKKESEELNKKMQEIQGKE